MKKSIKTVIAGILLVPILTLSAIIVSPIGVFAADCDTHSGIANGVECGNSTSTPDDLFGNKGIFTTIINVVLFVIGAISVVMLIFGGVRYTISGGESKAVESAKNTILYAIIGLVIAILAFAIVNFVITSIK